MGISVAGIIVVDSLVLIAKRLDVGDMGGRWEFPGGKVDDGETPEQALAREYLEEFNAEVKINGFICEESFEHRGKTVKLLVYDVQFVNEDEINWVLTEHSELKWVQFDEILNLNFVDSDMKAFPKVKKYFEN